MNEEKMNEAFFIKSDFADDSINFGKLSDITEDDFKPLQKMYYTSQFIKYINRLALVLIVGFSAYLLGFQSGTQETQNQKEVQQQQHVK